MRCLRLLAKLEKDGVNAIDYYCFSLLFFRMRL